MAAILTIPLTIVAFQQKFHCASENGEPLVATFDVTVFFLLDTPILAFFVGGVRPCKERTAVTPSNVDDNE